MSDHWSDGLPERVRDYCGTFRSIGTCWYGCNLADVLVTIWCSSDAYDEEALDEIMERWSELERMNQSVFLSSDRSTEIKRVMAVLAACGEGYGKRVEEKIRMEMRFVTLWRNLPEPRRLIGV